MIELESIEVENFRAFGTARFEPAAPGDGMTAITGANGTGKSSLVAALIWALYGVSPEGVPVRALRRQGSEGPVVAKITFRHDGQTIEVTRSLRGKNDTTVADIRVDGVQQTNVSARTATAWVAARLHLDAEAFLTAFVVRQKELDDLVTARPADRRRTIERLAGVERMSQALDLARQNAREAQRALAAMPAPEQEPDDIRAALAALDETGGSLREDAERAGLAARQAVELAAEAEERHDELASSASRAADARARLEILDNRIATGVEHVASLHSAQTAAEDLPHAQSAVAAAEDALAAADAATARVSACEQRAAELQKRAAGLQDGVEQAHRSSVDAAAAHARSQEKLAALDADKTGAELADTDRHIEKFVSRAGALESELHKTESSLTALAAHHAPNCPTCETPLPHPETLIASLRHTADQLREELAGVRERIAAGQAHRAKLAARIDEVARMRTEDARFAAAADRAHAEAQRLAAELDTIVDAADAAAEEAFEAKQAASDSAAERGELRATLDAARRVLHDAQRAAEQAAGLADAEQTLASLRQERGLLAGSLEEPASAEDIAAAAARRQEAREARETAREAAAGLATSVALHEREHAETQAALVRAETAASRRAAAFEAAEQAVAVAAAVEEFRRDRLARLAPELSEVASDFVSQMTDGRYITVELDEDFTPVVTDADGVSRPSSWLSGGEESAVALALRVAIGEVLAGHRGGMLILDEVLTAQDASRRTATVAAIRELPRQTITINHVAEATDMVDHVVESVPGPDGSELVVHDKRGLSAIPALDS